jgi:hypothetical protein
MPESCTTEDTEGTEEDKILKRRGWGEFAEDAERSSEKGNEIDRRLELKTNG